MVWKSARPSEDMAPLSFDLIARMRTLVQAWLTAVARIKLFDP
jgi:hypothetical protein